MRNSAKTFLGATVLGMLVPILAIYTQPAFATSSGIGSVFLLILSACLYASEESKVD